MHADLANDADRIAQAGTGAQLASKFVGEASFQCIIPPYIEDFAPAESKSLWLSIFFTAKRLRDAYEDGDPDELYLSWMGHIPGLAAPFIYLVHTTLIRTYINTVGRIITIPVCITRSTATDTRLYFFSVQWALIHAVKATVIICIHIGHCTSAHTWF